MHNIFKQPHGLLDGLDPPAPPKCSPERRLHRVEGVLRHAVDVWRAGGNCQPFLQGEGQVSPGVESGVVERVRDAIVLPLRVALLQRCGISDDQRQVVLKLLSRLPSSNANPVLGLQAGPRGSGVKLPSSSMPGK